MNRPYIVCHILSALDGKITGEFMGTEKSLKTAGEYGRIRKEYHADAWLYGSVTTKEFIGGRQPVLVKDEKAPDGDYVVNTNAELYYISIDVEGEVGWESGTFQKAGRPDAHVIEVLTESTPVEYRAYLRKQGVSYIIAGTDTLDCKIAVEKLYSLFGIKSVLICGGGVVNWSFLQSGVVDELSLVLAPAADGNRDSVTVFEKLSSLPQHAPMSFSLKNVEQLNGDGVRLVYTVDIK